MDSMDQNDKKVGVYVSVSGVYYSTTMDRINEVQKELNKQISRGYEDISLRKVLEVITEDWPEDKREEFWRRHDTYCGWDTVDFNGELGEFKLHNASTLDKNVLSLDFTPFEKEPK